MLLASSVSGLFKWRQFEPEVILLAVGWYLRFSLSYRDVEELLAERGLHADHVTVWRWVQRYAPENGTTVCALGSDRPTTVGEWTKPTSGSRASGSIYTGLSTPAVRRSTSFCRLTRRSSGRAISRQGFGRREPSSAAGHQHRRARRLSTGHRAAQSRGGSEGELPASTGAISQQRPGTGSSGDQTPDTRKPAFSLVLGSLAHDRRLRSDPYDPQRPDVRKSAGGGSTPLLHTWFVQRGDGLILRTLSIAPLRLNSKVATLPRAARAAVLKLPKFRRPKQSAGGSQAKGPKITGSQNAKVGERQKVGGLSIAG